MKKNLLVVLIALCGVSFSFGANSSEECLECLVKKESAANCVGDCAVGEGLSDGKIDTRPKKEDKSSKKINHRSDIR